MTTPLLSDVNFWLGVAGTLFTVSGIYISFSLAGRRTIRFSIPEEIQLVDDIASQNLNLRVEYKGQRVANEVSLVKISLVNFGNRDIAESDVDRPITIDFGERVTVLETSVDEDRTDPRVSLLIKSQNTIEVSFPLFKARDLISLRCVVSVAGKKQEKGSAIADTVTVYSRIKDIKRIGRLSVPPIETIKRSHRAALLSLVFCSLVGLSYPPLWLDYETAGYRFVPAAVVDVPQDCSGAKLVQMSSGKLALMTQPRGILEFIFPTWIGRGKVVREYSSLSDQLADREWTPYAVGCGLKDSWMILATALPILMILFSEGRSLVLGTRARALIFREKTAIWRQILWPRKEASSDRTEE